MTTWTAEANDRLVKYLASHELVEGMGTWHEACSISAINIALTDTLSDDIPPCMSLVVGKWITPIQDAMPPNLRNSPEWKRLLPRAADTGEPPGYVGYGSPTDRRRLDIIMEWLFDTVLPLAQPLADECGFGPSWARMSERRSGGGGLALMVSADSVYRRLTGPPLHLVATRRMSDIGRYVGQAGAYSNAESQTIWDWWNAAWNASHVAKKTASLSLLTSKVPYPWDVYDPCGMLEKLINAEG